MAVNFLGTLGNKFSNVGSNLANALLGSTQTTSGATGQYPMGIQNYLDSLENQPYMQKLLNQPKSTGLTLNQYKEGIAQGLNFGVPEIADAQNALKINTPKTGEEIELARTGDFNSYPLQAGLGTSPRQGGLLNDFYQGYKENYNNGFDPNNFGQKKNFATRLGEGLGTLGRFANSPLGQSLIAYGLNNALGYDDSVLEGLTAFAGRKNAINEDSLYRNSLAQSGIDVSGIKGNVTSDVYKNLIANTYKFRNLDQNTYTKLRTLYDRQLQQGILTPEEYTANIEALNQQYVNSQIQTMQAGNVGVSNQTRNTDMNQELLPYKKYALQVSPQVAMGNLGVAQGNLALRQAELPYDIAYKQMQIDNMVNKNTIDKAAQKQAETMGNLTAIENQLGRFENSFGDVNNPYRYRLAGGVSEKLNTLSPEEANFNSQRTLLFNKIARDLGGEKGVLSNQDIKRIEQSLPTLSDTTAQKRAKMQAIYNLLEDRKKSVNAYTPQNQAASGANASGQTQTIGKYKVRVK